MSAFLVDNEHINVMVYMASEPYHHMGPLTWTVPDENAMFGYAARIAHYNDQARATEIGQMLVDQNMASVNARYDEDNEAVYTYERPRFTVWSPIEVIKAIHCYEYQACETKDWDQTEAHQFCRALESRMIDQLPGYSKADTWGITKDTTPLGGI